MKSLVEYCNEAMKPRKGARWEAAKKVDQSIRDWVEEKKKDKDYKIGNPYNSDLQVEYHDGDARIKVQKSGDGYLAFAGNALDDIDNSHLLKGDCPKNVKVLVKFTQLLSREDGQKETYQLFDTTNESTRDTIGRARPEIWYSPDKDQLYDAFFKKITKPGKAKSEVFNTLFCGFIAAINPDTQYTKEWFNK